MFESKYSKVLTVILVIVIIAIIGLLGFLAYDYYQNYMITNDTSDFVDNFQGEVTDGEASEEDTVADTNITNPFDEIKDSNTGTGSQTKKSYKGFEVWGTMEIPKTNFKYPVLAPNITTKKLETSVVFLYGSGLNEVGNSVISGHNYRNGLFFSNNKKLSIGDKIYVTDNNGNKIEYTIYNKFETTPEDTSFYQRDTAGKPELTLSTCTDDSKARLIIFARPE